MSNGTMWVPRVLEVIFKVGEPDLIEYKGAGFPSLRIRFGKRKIAFMEDIEGRVRCERLVRMPEEHFYVTEDVLTLGVMEDQSFGDVEDLLLAGLADWLFAPDPIESPVADILAILSGVDAPHWLKGIYKMDEVPAMRDTVKWCRDRFIDSDKEKGKGKWISAELILEGAEFMVQRAIETGAIPSRNGAVDREGES